MKLIQIISLLTSTLFFHISKANTLNTSMVVQSLNAEDSVIVFEKMKHMEKLREITGSGRELEHRLYKTSDKALTIHCVAFVSPIGDSFLAQECKVIIKPHLSRPNITAISKFAEGQGTIVTLNETSDNEILFTQFLNSELAFYSKETVSIKIDNEVQTLPILTLKCPTKPTLSCHLTLFSVGILPVTIIEASPPLY